MMASISRATTRLGHHPDRHGWNPAGAVPVTAIVSPMRSARALLRPLEAGVGVRPSGAMGALSALGPRMS